MLQYPEFDPVALRIGPVAIHWYGLMYLVGFALVYLLGRRRIQSGHTTTLTTRDLEDVIFYSVLGVVLGGRLGYVLFYKPSHYLSHPLEVLYLWEGGMSFHGGLIGVILVMFLFARKKGLPFFAISDFIAPMIPLGLGFGRLGNFINGELWGRPSDVPWAMVFPQSGDGGAIRPSSMSWARRHRAVCTDVVVFQQAAAPGTGERGLPDRLRNVPLPGGIHPRAGQLPGPARGRTEHGTVAVPADGGAGRHPVQPYCKTIVPLTATLTVTSPDSRGTSAL